MRPRNYRAHEFLLKFMFEKNVGVTTFEEAVEELQQWAEIFKSRDAEVSSISDEVLREMGVDPREPALTDEELHRIVRKVKDEEDI
jgi:hypothetical protein